jgi:hypothetical protein
MQPKQDLHKGKWHRKLMIYTYDILLLADYATNGSENKLKV